MEGKLFTVYCFMPSNFECCECITFQKKYNENTFKYYKNSMFILCSYIHINT